MAVVCLLLACEVDRGQHLQATSTEQGGHTKGWVRERKQYLWSAVFHLLHLFACCWRVRFTVASTCRRRAQSKVGTLRGWLWPQAHARIYVHTPTPPPHTHLGE